MTDAEKAIRLSKLAREFNVGISTLVDFLGKKGHKIESNPNTKVDITFYDMLAKEFGAEINLKQESKKVSLINLREKKESVSIEDVETTHPDEDDSVEDEVIVKNITPDKETFKADKPQIGVTVMGKIDLEPKPKKTPEPQDDTQAEEAKKEEDKPKAAKPKVEHIETEKQQLAQPKVVGKVDLEAGKKSTKIIKKASKQDREIDETKKDIQVDDKQKVADPQEEAKVSDKPGIARKPKEEVKFFRSEVEKLSGPTVVGKIDLTTVEVKKKTAQADTQENGRKKKRRKRIRKDNQKVAVTPEAGRPSSTQPKPATSGAGLQISKKKKKKQLRQEVDEEEVQKQIDRRAHV